jgi:bla regulator protein blaR1
MARAFSVVVLVALVASSLSAQTRVPSAADGPAFEVATIKPSGADSAPMSIRRLPGGRFVTSNTPLPMLIAWAYGVDDGRLFGVPKGLDAAGFDVVAKASEAEPAAGQTQLMLRALLAERFKLVVHQETRELTAYELVNDAGGPKVRVVESSTPPDPNPFSMSAAGRLTGTRVTTDMLAKVLSNQLGRPVKNATGFANAFDFTLQWTPDTATGAIDDPQRPSLMTAVREQLGFRLVAKKTPVDVVVIDHVESTPTAN